MGVQQPKFTEPRRKKFLEMMEKTNLFYASAQVTGCCQATIRTYLRKNPDFVKEVEQAKERHYEKIEKEVLRRAIEGIDKPLSYQGQLTGHSVKEYSDRLLELYARRHIKEYREKVEIDQNTNLTGEIKSDLDGIMKSLTPDKRELLKKLLTSEEDEANS